ncbi:MAG: PhoH family protein [Acidimicrobiia bacterium]|nr:PhoH family protein [Acidimicrobiia bacterium]
MHQPTTYVLDTSVLLADPDALFRFEDNHVVLPLVVLTELEGKRHHPDLGWAARTSLRSLEVIRVHGGGLEQAVPITESGGTLRVELNHVDPIGLPAALADGGNDARILTVAHNLARDGRGVVLVSKDLPLRLKASVVGIEAEEYRNEMSTAPQWDGFVPLEVDADRIDALFETGAIHIEAAAGLPCNTGLALTAGSQSALARVRADGSVRLVSPDASVFEVRGRNTEQRIAIDVLNDDSIGIVSLGGNAGTGKSVLALAAGLEAVLERQTHRRVLVFRPLYAVGGQELGYLPGDENEKMAPWAAAVTDALEAIVGDNVIDEVLGRRQLEVLPLTHIRGRSLTDSFVIIDEAQNLERGVLLTALTRLGHNSRVVLTHDVAQRDNLHVGRYDGVAAVIARLRGNPLFAHVTLRRSERSPVARLVTDMLDAGRLSAEVSRRLPQPSLPGV